MDVRRQRIDLIVQEYLMFESSRPNGYFMYDHLRLPGRRSSVEKQTTTDDGKLITTFSEESYDLAGDWSQTWVVALDLSTKSYLPQSYREVNDNSYDGPMGGKGVQQTKYKPVTMEWLDLPHYCQQQ